MDPFEYLSCRPHGGDGILSSVEMFPATFGRRRYNHPPPSARIYLSRTYGSLFFTRNSSLFLSQGKQLARCGGRDIIISHAGPVRASASSIRSRGFFPNDSRPVDVPEMFVQLTGTSSCSRESDIPFLPADQPHGRSGCPATAPYWPSSGRHLTSWPARSFLTPLSPAAVRVRLPEVPIPSGTRRGPSRCTMLRVASDRFI